MTLMKVLKKPEQLLEKLSLKTLTIYLGIFSMMAVFIIGFLLGVLIRG